MSYFYGMISGARGTDATRTGSKDSGIDATVRTWDGNIEVSIRHDKNDAHDRTTIYARPEHGGSALLGSFDHGALMHALKRNDRATLDALQKVQDAIIALDNTARSIHALDTQAKA